MLFLIYMHFIYKSLKSSTMRLFFFCIFASDNKSRQMKTYPLSFAQAEILYTEDNSCCHSSTWWRWQRKARPCHNCHLKPTHQQYSNNWISHGNKTHSILEHHCLYPRYYNDSLYVSLPLITACCRRTSFRKIPQSKTKEEISLRRSFRAGWNRYFQILMKINSGNDVFLRFFS